MRFLVSRVEVRDFTGRAGDRELCEREFWGVEPRIVQRSLRSLLECRTSRARKTRTTPALPVMIRRHDAAIRKLEPRCNSVGLPRRSPLTIPHISRANVRAGGCWDGLRAVRQFD